MQNDRGPVRVHGPALRFARETRRRSIADLAREVGVSRPYLSMVEGGHRDRIRAELLEHIARALDIDPQVVMHTDEVRASLPAA